VITPGRAIYQIVYVLFAPVRLLLNARPTLFNFQQEMRRSPSLEVECRSGSILVRPVRHRHRGQLGARAIAEAMRHVQPAIASVRPYTERESATFGRLTGHNPVGPGHLVYKLPVEIPRSSTFYDERAWDALCQRVSELDSPISLAQFERLEIESYVTTRPPGFDLTEYYRANM
jgi:hypothetical protein